MRDQKLIHCVPGKNWGKVWDRALGKVRGRKIDLDLRVALLCALAATAPHCRTAWVATCAVSTAATTAATTAAPAAPDTAIERERMVDILRLLLALFMIGRLLDEGLVGVPDVVEGRDVVPR